MMENSTQIDKSHCLICGASNASVSRFCNNCGAPLGVPSSAYADTITASGPPRATPDGAAQDEVHDQLKGRVIDGRYRIDSLIGLGGMGSVYRATRVLIGDEVAIKILHTERVTDPQAAERFRREAQAAARLKHPNAVSIYDFGISSDGLQYLVMELVEGDSLRQLIKQHGVVEPAIAAEITAQTCAALDEAHRQQIVHRDVKPDNIIVNPSPHGLRVKVLDFGIAKLRDDAASHLTQTGSVMGTPHYMSPEQCLGEELDARADIYSMGIVLYEMLCGRVPFNSPVSTAVVVQHVNQPPPPLRSFNTGISPQLEATVFHALQKQREARPPSAGAFARECSSAVTRAADQQSATMGATSTGVQSAGGPEGAAAFAFTPPKELAPTIHLATVSGQVAGARATSGTGTVALPVMNRAKIKTAIAATIAVALLTIGGLVYWNASQKDDSKKDSAATHYESTVPMVYVPGGKFLMGSTNLIVGDEDSKPAHYVTVKPFHLDVFEVTCEEYKKCVDAKKCSQPMNWLNGNYPSGTARHPVTGVSWPDANAYAQWVGKRLPTEEEWEFAARGPQGLLYPWGASWKVGCANAAQAANGMNDVGTYKCESPFGAFDLIGNAWEWTSSPWMPYPNGRLSKPGQGDEKVIRGGSWESPQDVTSSFRTGLGEPGTQTGFRCARDSN